MSDAPPNTPDSGASPAPLPPPRVPDHELIRRIGRGAYGEVWLARSATGACRAVKVVHRCSFDHDRPFEREFEGILKFEPISRTHESQVDILHVGRGDDCFYYVMELADDQATGGQINPDAYAPRTLKSDLMFHGRLPFEECVRIGIALATALEQLHQNGLVHRDVKPSNIIFVNGVPKLADIGLVTGVDATRSYVGTEGFAAPEGPGTPQADLYSLGKVLYEAATGKDRQEFPELPTQLRELPDREGLMELNAVIAKACRHNPKDRYETAAAMQADLELLQSGKSLARLRRTEARLRFVQRAGLVVTAVAALIGAGWLWQARQTHLVRELAAEKARLAEERTRLADENRERLVRLNVANGARLLDEQPDAALLWLSEALPLVTNTPAESTHRLRIQQIVDSLPVPISVIPHENPVKDGAFSKDGRLLATGTGAGDLSVWDAHTGAAQWTHKPGFRIRQVRFTRDGRSLFVSGSPAPNSGRFEGFGLSGAAIFDLKGYKTIFQTMSTNSLTSAFSPDDRWLSLGQSNNLISVVDAREGKAVLELSGHTSEITSFSFTSDGSLLASASSDQTVRLWRLPSGKPLGEPLQHLAPVKRVRFSGDGRRLATICSALSGQTNWSLQIWDTATCATLGASIPVGVTEECLFSFVDATGRRLLIATDRALGHKPTYFLNVDTREEVAISASVDSPRCMAFSPDGRSVAIGEDGGWVRVFDLLTGELVLPPIRQSGWVESLEFSADGSRILAATEQGVAIVWRLKSPAVPVEMRFDAAHPAWERPKFLRSLDLQQRRFLLPLMDGTIHLVDLERWVELQKLNSTVTTNAPMVRSSPDGRRWAAQMEWPSLWGNEERPDAVDLWSEDHGTLRHLLLEHPQRVGFMQFNSTSTHLLTHCGDQRIRWWRTGDGGLDRTILLPDEVTRWVAIFPDGRTALLRRRDNLEGQLFDLATEKVIGTPLQIKHDIRSLDFDLDSGRFATATADNCGRIWSARTGDPLTPPLRQVGDIHSILWSPDHRRIITAGLGASKVWDSTTGDMVLPELSATFGSARVAMWSLNGRLIVAPASARSARLWDATTGEPVTQKIGSDGYIRLATMVGNRLVVLSDPNALRAWDLKETPLPGGVISDYARLLCGKRLDGNGILAPLKPRELAALFASLRQRAPELFQ